MLSNEVKKIIEDNLQTSVCYVNEFSGGTDHYSVTVVSDLFIGKPLLARHRMIMDLFKNEVESGEIHALSIQAHTVEQWNNQSKNQNPKA